MAWIEQPASGNYQVVFRFEDQKYKKSLRTKDRKAAEARLQRVRELIQLVENGRIAVPEDIDLFLSDGATNVKPKSKAAPRTLRRLCDAFLAAFPMALWRRARYKGWRYTHDTCSEYSERRFQSAAWALPTYSGTLTCVQKKMVVVGDRSGTFNSQRFSEARLHLSNVSLCCPYWSAT
jgi:hypothetical protein